MYENSLKKFSKYKETKMSKNVIFYLKIEDSCLKQKFLNKVKNIYTIILSKFSHVTATFLIFIIYIHTQFQAIQESRKNLAILLSSLLVKVMNKVMICNMWLVLPGFLPYFVLQLHSI